jgi:hypothetical protein
MEYEKQEKLYSYLAKQTSQLFRRDKDDHFILIEKFIRRI